MCQAGRRDMEIDFNSSRVSKAQTSQPVVRPEVASATDAASFQVTSALESQLKNLPAVRPEKIAQAQALLSDSQYPPDYVLERIAVLIASHVKS
jgi:hypothetical protein